MNGSTLALTAREAEVMKARIAMLAAMSMFAVFISAPVHLRGQQPADPQAHEQHHPEATAAQAAPAQPNMAAMSGMMSRMRANDAKLDDLVKKMNSATGAAKTDAIAALLTALVEDRKNIHEPMMANMMSMMNMMGGNRMGGAAPAGK
jgi:hypothetical protein